MKFKYLDKIKVIDGFYKGLHGIVIKHDETNMSYYVTMRCLIDNELTYPETWITCELLERI